MQFGFHLWVVLQFWGAPAPPPHSYAYVMYIMYYILCYCDFIPTIIVLWVVLQFWGTPVMEKI